MALVKRVSKVDVAVEEKERLGLGDLVPQYEWETSAGAERSGIKLHYLSFLPERQDGEKAQPAQMSGFLDGMTDPVTGSARGGRNCVPLRVTGAAGIAMAARVAGAIALAETGDPKAAKVAMDTFEATEPMLIKGGSLYLDMRPEAAAEALRGEDSELVALYATSSTLSGRMMYAPPFEFEEGFE